ncbi:hypothetical protein RJ639_047685 [Escallonia herrerae]|uniref:Retrotransposon Copia-like N-terminal domain-containing protein n=1 Tax=Escallonia herrerae TaxID=1293975 RepID=A0AA88W762_9ASTE|nr:hypothetical protein RJ639_047685 [Escallonia herrerae]
MAKDAETSKPKHLDPTSEYYLSSQANSGNSLTKDTLKGDNYVAWEQSAILTLKSHNKLAFIDGRITKPDPKSEDFLAWDIVNSTLCFWICNSLDPPIRDTVSRLNEAKLIWNSLKTRYSMPNRSRIYKLWSDVSMTTQGGTSVMTYYTKLLGMWDELLTLLPLESCGCPKGTEKMNWYQDLQTYQFLMGLDDKYATLHTQIINMDLFPNIDRVYAMVMQEESHRGITGSRDTTPAVGFHAQNGPPIAWSSGIVPATAGDPDRTPTERPWCTFCHRVGHTHEKCYRSLGIAPPGKGRGRGSPAMSQNVVRSLSGPLQASATMTQNISPSLGQAQAATTSALPVLTPEQMQRLITFLESSQSGTDSLVGPHFEEPDWIGLIHCDIWGPYQGRHTTSDRGRSATLTGFHSFPWSAGITAGPDPEISSLASPPSSPTTPSPIPGRGKRQKNAHSVLKDYVCHNAQVLPPASSTPTNGSSGPRYPLANFVSCKSFSAAHTQFLDAVSSSFEPRSYKAAS